MRYLVFILTGLILIAVGCGEEAPTTSAPESAPKAALPASLFTTTAPQNASDIPTAKQSAKSGDTVTIRGRIGGRAEPFAENRAVLTLADLSLPSCENSPMDDCKTPWDSCCEPAEDIAARSATVQVTDSEGKPLKQGLNGANGLAPGKEIVVTGTAQRDEQAGTLVVNAREIFVAP